MYTTSLLTSHHHSRYFTPSILQAAGVRDNQTVLLLSLGPAGINAAGTVVGMFCIERSVGAVKGCISFEEPGGPLSIPSAREPFPL